MKARTARAALAIIATVILPGIGRAQSPSPEAPRGIEVQPAAIERDLGGRAFSQTLTYFNHKDTTQTIALTLREIWNARDTPGASAFTESTAISNAFSLSRSKLTIPAGGKGTVTLSGSIPSGRRSAYPAVIAELPHAAGSAVEAQFQLASIYLLRAPKPWTQRIAVTDVGLIPDAGKTTYTVFATVKNIGNVHVRPRGSVEIRRAGEVLATVRLPLNANGQPFAVLPTCAGGCSVRLRATWSPRAPVTGDVTLTARFTDPAASLARTVQLSSGAKGTLAASITVAAISASSLVATVRNDGGVTLSQANVRFTARDGAHERGRADFPQASLDPGKQREISWVPDAALPNGRYVITAELFVGDRSLSVATTTLQVGPVGSSRLILLIVAGLLLLVAATWWFLFWKRRRRSPSDGEPAVRGAA